LAEEAVLGVDLVEVIGDPRCCARDDAPPDIRRHFVDSHSSCIAAGGSKQDPLRLKELATAAGESPSWAGPETGEPGLGRTAAP
jgi:hypothetical protein